MYDKKNCAYVGDCYPPASTENTLLDHHYPFSLSRLKLTFTLQHIYATFEWEKTPDGYGIFSIKRARRPHKYAVD